MLWPVTPHRVLAVMDPPPTARVVLVDVDGRAVWSHPATGFPTTEWTACAATSDGRFVAAAADAQVFLVGPGARKPSLHRIEVYSDVRCLAISSDRLLIGDADGRVTIVDRACRRRQIVDSGRYRPVEAIAVSPCGRLGAAAWSEGLLIFDAVDGATLDRLPTGHRPVALAISPDGLVAVCPDRVWVVGRFAPCGPRLAQGHPQA